MLYPPWVKISTAPPPTRDVYKRQAQVLAGAAVRGDVDKLKGLKENVIIGHLIPAGTSFEDCKDIIVREAATAPEGPPPGEVFL